MAINPNDRYPGQTTAPSADYPYGGARNQSVPGDNTGTPLEADLVNDIFGFQQALLEEAGIVPSGTPETATASQYKDALDSIYQRKDAGYQLANIEIIDTPGASTYTVPAGVRALRIIAIGGGGAGGGAGAPGSGESSAGAGGGAGGIGVRWITSVTTSYAYTVGAGGVGVSGGAGGDGGSTTIADVTAGGGGGGGWFAPGSISGAAAFPGGAGGVSGTFDYQMGSNPGGAAFRITGVSVVQGYGGAGPFGRVSTNSPASGFGVGGSGRGAGPEQGPFAGYNGAPGAIIIEEYV